MKPIEIKDPRKNRECSKERPKSKILVKNKGKSVEKLAVNNKMARTTKDFKILHESELKTEINQESTNMVTNMMTNQLTNISSLEPSNSNFRIEDMLTLSIAKSCNSIGQVKKMVHSNTLNVYAIRVSILITNFIKEVPIISKELRNDVKDYFTEWKKIKEYHNLVEVYKEFINTPEG